MLEPLKPIFRTKYIFCITSPCIHCLVFYVQVSSLWPLYVRPALISTCSSISMSLEKRTNDCRSDHFSSSAWTLLLRVRSTWSRTITDMDISAGITRLEYFFLFSIYETTLPLLSLSITQSYLFDLACIDRNYWLYLWIKYDVICRNRCTGHPKGSDYVWGARSVSIYSVMGLPSSRIYPAKPS